MLTNVLMSTAEQTWWNLTFEERVHYERCVHHIVYTHFHNDTRKINDFLFKANQLRATPDSFYRLTDTPIIAAICWRIEEELSDE